jgi:hypothetical protein
MENKEQAVKELGNQISADIQAGKKPPIINRFMKHFFFSALKKKKEFKDAEQTIGKLVSVTLILLKVKEKSFIRALGKKDQKDVPMNAEDVDSFYKNFNVTQESIDKCKSIFVQLNFETKIISIQQNYPDGTNSLINI